MHAKVLHKGSIAHEVCFRSDSDGMLLCPLELELELSENVSRRSDLPDNKAKR